MRDSLDGLGRCSEHLSETWPVSRGKGKKMTINFCRIVKAVTCHDCKEKISEEDAQKYPIGKKFREVYLCGACFLKREHPELR